MDKTPATPTIPIDKLRPYFRDLSLSVFNVFQFGSLSRTILDTDSNTKEQTEISLQPPQLIFLLQDLCNKLTSSFQTFGPRVSEGVWLSYHMLACVCGVVNLSIARSSVGVWLVSMGVVNLSPPAMMQLNVNKAESSQRYSQTDLVILMTDLVSSLCEQLENTSAYFQVRPSHVIQSWHLHPDL